MGGVVYASGAGYLNVYYSNFVNNTGSEGNDIAYYYTTKKNNAAFLTYDYNEFWGANNSSGSIYAYNTQYLVVNHGNHNQFHDIDEYVTPIEENSTTDNNGTNPSTNFISIPEGITIGSQLWNASLDGDLGGTPLINGDYIYVPNGHNVYCYNINTGALLWNVSSQWGYFHELALHNNVIIAPCSWDKLYFIDATTGALIQNESNIYPGSSIYAPLVVGDRIYISSEYAYDNAWIAVIEYVNGEYVYNGNILEIYDVPYGEQGLLSEPVMGEDGNIWVNTRNGIMYLNPDDWYDYNLILNGTVGKPVVSEYGIYTLNQNNKLYIISYDNYMTYSLDINNGIGNSLAYDGNVLVMVCADGTILRLTPDFWILDFYQINPVSSNIYAKDNYLCIGDDAGILWVFGDYISSWAFNVSSPILKTPTVHNDIVFIGTNDTIYALYDPSFMNMNSNILPLKYNFKSNNLLKLANNDLLSDNILLNHVYVTKNGNGDGSSFENAISLENAIKNVQSNSIIHIADGEYTISSAIITLSNKQNITIQAENFGKVNISITKALAFNGFNNFTIKGLNFKYSIKALTFGLFSDTANKIRFSCSNIYIDSCSFDGLGKSFNAISPTSVRNFTISNCNFTNSQATFIALTAAPADYTTTSMPPTYTIVSEANINITNCEFTKCSNIPLTFSGTTGNLGNLEVIVNYYIENCKFLNNTGKNSISITATTDNHKNIFNILNNYFESNGNNHAIIAKGGILTFEKNNVTSDYAIQLDTNSKVVSQLTFRILNNKSVKVPVNESVDLIGELVDDKGNRIYHAGLKLEVNGSEKSPIFNQDNGLYILSFTPENIGELLIDVKCNAIDELDSDLFNLIVSGNPNLTVNCNNSIYGEPFNVNVTLNEAVSGENVTFTIVDSEGNVIKSTNSKIDNAFASVSFEYLPVGDYTVSVTYDGDENFGTSTVSKTFTVNKANSTVEIIIDPTIPVGDNISVQAIVPVNAVGNVTFRLNTENRTVNVSDKAVFDGLTNGTYIIYARFNGDNNYNPSEEYNVTFSVVKVNPVLNIVYSAPVINETVTITVTMDDDISESVNVTINGDDPVSKDVVNGNLVFTMVPAYGQQNITVNFKGNDKYNEFTNSTLFMVEKLNADLSIAAEQITYGDVLVVNVNTNEKFTGDVIVKIGELNQTAHITNGKGNATFANLIAAEYFITANFTENDIFNADNKNTTATVKGVEVPADKVLNTNVPANSQSPTFSINLPGATGNFTVSVDGKVIDTKELNNGNANITVANLPVGNHKVSVSYSGDGKYAPISQNITVTIKELAKTPSTTPAKVTPKATKIVAKKKTFKAKKKVKKYTITLKSGKTLLKKVKVTLKVKGKTYKATTNKKGKATFKIKNLKKKGTYKAVIKFKGNKNYKASSKKVKIKVKK